MYICVPLFSESVEHRLLWTIEKFLQSALGMLLFLGVGREDTAEDVEWLATKVSRSRIWEDEEGLMNRSIEDVDGSVLVVSQFTLWET